MHPNVHSSTIYNSQALKNTFLKKNPNNLCSYSPSKEVELNSLPLKHELCLVTYFQKVELEGGKK